MEKNLGGKANSLIKLKKHGFNVPDFFVIDSLDYKNFLEENNLREKIKVLLKEEKFEEIKDLLLSSKMSEELENSILDNFSLLNTDEVSVRSSASNEDGKEKSFAGQFSTFLNVTKEKLIYSVKLCWASLYAQNVLLYSEEENIDDMNVVVQKMINSDFSGVAFTVDPTSDTHNYSFIECVKGVGESLVSGEVTPFKFLVRRETRHIDLKIGESLVSDEVIEELENIILRIEELYKMPMDTEYAIKDNQIFILQARPITAFTPVLKSFSLSISRPNSLIEECIYFKGEYEGIKSVTRDLYYFKPLFLYNKENENTSIYYNEFDLEEDPRMMYYYMDLDYEIILKKCNEAKESVKKLDNIIDNDLEYDINLIISDLIQIYPFISLGQLAGHFDNISDRLREVLYDFRLSSDYIVHKTSDYILAYFEKQLSCEYKKYSKFITLEEAINNNLPSIDELEKRLDGYVYYGRLYTTNDYDKWAVEHNISIVKEDVEATLKGQVVYGKDVQGKVCKIFNESHFSKFEDGDILVTPMTTPKFIKVIRKASAILTDEGGVTCHAAIISRELKIPCVVGCKSVTKVLKDGDMVKINGATGEISVL